jgi:hypothetical protein
MIRSNKIESQNRLFHTTISFHYSQEIIHPITIFAGEISHFAGEIKVFVGRPAPNTCHSCCWVLAHLAPLKAQDFHQASLQQSDEQPRMFQHAILMGVPTQRLPSGNLT